MFYKVLLFELRGQVRRPSFYIGLIATVLLIFLITTSVLLRAGEAQAMLKLNGPIMAARLLAFLSVVTLLIPLIVFGRAALRDVESGMEELVRATPAPRAGLLLARLGAAFLIVTLIYATAAPTAELAFRMPWVDTSLVGAFRADAYLRTYAFLLLPNILIFGCLAFVAASWTRGISSAYGLFILFVGLLIITTTTRLKFSPAAGPLLDPFGISALNRMTRYWATAQQNASAMPIKGILLWNRLLWGGIALSLLGATVVFLPRSVKGRRAAAGERAFLEAVTSHVAIPALQPGGATAMDQLWARLHYEARVALRSWTFLFMLILLAAVIIGLLLLPGEDVTAAYLPVTVSIAPNVTQAAALTGLLMIALFAGETVWRERASHISEIIDATPVPSIVLLGGKLGALALLTLVYLLVAMAVGIGFQLWRGSADIALGTFLVHGMLGVVAPLVMTAVLAILVHAMVPNKYVGHLAMLGFVAVSTTVYVYGFEDNLIHFATIPSLPVSVMNGFGHYLDAALWFTAYWAAASMILAILTQSLWARGLRTSLTDRIRNMRHRMSGASVAAGICALLVMAGCGSVIYWNTHVLNKIVTQWDIEVAKASYERHGSEDLRKPQPRIAEIDMSVDIDPDRRMLHASGRYLLVNRTAAPIDTVRVQFNDELNVEQVALQGAALVTQEPVFNDYVFQPAQALAPGESLTLTFAATMSNAGFRNGELASPAAINANGSFIDNSQFAPWIGIAPQFFLTDAVRRRKFGLPALGLAEHNGMIDEDRNFLARDSDFVRFGVTLSTNLDQTAIGPGSLKREWTEGGRRHFRYETDQPIMNFWSVLSGRYTTARGTWRNVELAVHHHPTQGQNVPRMLTAMQQSLDYYSNAFGPFQHSQLRIAEYPYGMLAQSWPATISMSESIAFMIDARADFVDWIGFVTAHEVAHQWWGHQAVPADMPGAQLLSETLAEYSALIVMEQLYGADRIRAYLQADLDFYLARRGKGDAETPLREVRLHQAHIAYKKGAVAMYAIKDAIGQEAMNRALRRYLEKFRNSSRPYPVANDFLTILREEAGPDHQALISDLFDRIVLWEFNAIQAHARPSNDGRWLVTVFVGARKVSADATGVEEPASLYDNVDIGLFDADPASREFTGRDVIALEKRRVSDTTMAFEFTTDRKPAFAGINPYLKLIEREPRDNLVPVTIKEEPALEQEEEDEEDNPDPITVSPAPSPGTLGGP